MRRMLHVRLLYRQLQHVKLKLSVVVLVRSHVRVKFSKVSRDVNGIPLITVSAPYFFIPYHLGFNSQAHSYSLFKI